ncbi:hypothetical protein HOK51_09690 [Candidatus Woesearchaeota archaeon]|jgi:multidrug transporter EmrE-like cation transporter|nr:hypothetical protein [Candidatus Woesearchaeota archaeon]MBT6520095.1 hypothetical protein [Candidatus Woesearchaeota archaeon]MBT7366700.1 hypothetical protein [Candidatus Woesearchaeota archaeon]
MSIAIALICAGIGVTIGDALLAGWARGNGLIFLLSGLIFNIIGIIFYATTLRIESIGVATAMFLAINIVAVSLYGMFFLRDHISISKICGIILIIFAIILIEI